MAVVDFIGRLAMAAARQQHQRVKTPSAVGTPSQAVRARNLGRDRIHQKTEDG